MSKIEREHTCENCYYEEVDGYAYPCNRCSHNKPTDDMWRQRSASMSEWIPVSEGLPEKNGEYLVSYEDAVTILKFFNGKWFLLWKSDTIAHEETEPNLAWMPLPEPCEALK